LEFNRILQGSSLDILRTLSNDSIDCVITSPPYYGLRSYENTVSLWGGDCECQHEWEEIRTSRPNASGGETEKDYKDDAQHYADYSDRASYSSCCKKCNCWQGQLGLEPTIDLYINHLCSIFDEIQRTLKPKGTCFVNLGDSYAGGNGRWQKDTRGCKGDEQGQLIDTSYKHKGEKEMGIKPKSLCLIPFRFAIEMSNRRWIVRNSIIWHKINSLPSSAIDRFSQDFEYVYFFTKNKKYHFEQQFESMSEATQKRDKYGYKGAFKTQFVGAPNEKRWQEGRPIENSSFYNEKGRNMRSVWSIPTKPFKDSHFAVFPSSLIEPMIKAGCPKGGIVLDPFMGSGTTAITSIKLKRNYLGIELNPEYIEMSNKRISKYIKSHIVTLGPEVIKILENINATKINKYM
jgi:site-specific DNA-methyltransferase (adenine-specific)